MSEQSWKMNFEATKVLEREQPVPVEEDGEESKEAAAQGEGEALTDSVAIQIEILKVPDQEKYAFDVKRKGGSCLLFYELSDKIKEDMFACNNVMLVEEEEEEGAA